MFMFWREGLLVTLTFSILMIRSHYENKIKGLQDDALVIIKSEAICKSNLDSQTLQIEANQIDLDKRTKELNEWKSKPERVRYEVIYKDKIMEVKSNDCNDTKKSIDFIRTINFNSL